MNRHANIKVTPSIGSAWNLQSSYKVVQHPVRTMSGLFLGGRHREELAFTRGPDRSDSVDCFFSFAASATEEFALELLRGEQPHSCHRLGCSRAMHDVAVVPENRGWDFPTVGLMIRSAGANEVCEILTRFHWTVGYAVIQFQERLKRRRDAVKCLVRIPARDVEAINVVRGKNVIPVNIAILDVDRHRVSVPHCFAHVIVHCVSHNAGSTVNSSLSSGQPIRRSIQIAIARVFACHAAGSRE